MLPDEQVLWTRDFCKLITIVRVEAVASSPSPVPSVSTSHLSLERTNRQQDFDSPSRRNSTLDSQEQMADKVQPKQIQDKLSSYSTASTIVSSSSVVSESDEENVKQLLQTSNNCNQLKVTANVQQVPSGQWVQSATFNDQRTQSVQSNQFIKGQYVAAQMPAIISVNGEKLMQGAQQQERPIEQQTSVMINRPESERSAKQQQQQQQQPFWQSNVPYGKGRPSEEQINYDPAKQSPQLIEAQKEATWKTYELTKCIPVEKPLGGLDLPVIGANTGQAKLCGDRGRPYHRYQSSTWSIGCCRVDSQLHLYQVSKSECCLLGGSRCELNGIACCNGQACCNGKCRMTAGFFTDTNLGLTLPYNGQPKLAFNVVPLIYAEYGTCSDRSRPHHYSFRQMHEKYFGCCVMPPASSETASKLCCLLARSACDGGIPCCNSASCINGRCPLESGDVTWPSLYNVTCTYSSERGQLQQRLFTHTNNLQYTGSKSSNNNNNPSNNPFPEDRRVPLQRQQQEPSPQGFYHRISRHSLIQLADPVYKYFYLSYSNSMQMHIACRRGDIGSFISDIDTGKQCCLMAGSPCSPFISCCRGVACCGGRCVKQAGSLEDRTGYSIAFNECHEKD